MGKKDGILTDYRHWLGWFISTIGITFLIVLIFHLWGFHDIHTPYWKIIIIFFSVFVGEVLIDTLKHLIKLQ